MKKYIIIALAAVVAFTACTKTNPEEKKSSSVISFQVANYVPQTKANVSLLGETEEFMSKAYLHANGVTGAQDYFGAAGETIQWFSADKEWRPAQTYYWPKSENSYLNFVSWFDNKTNTTAVTETTITWACNDIAADQNFMWADEAWGYKNNTTTYQMDGQAEPVGVPTLFHHALTKLSIKAKAATVSDGTTSWEITIENVSVSNNVKSAELTLTNTLTEAGATAGTAPYTAAWESKGVADFDVADSDVLTTDADDNILLDEKSVFPLLQADEALNFDIRIKTYRGTELRGEEVVNKSILFNTLGDPAITAWNSNTKYTYTLIINPATNIIKFDPAIEEWSTDDASAEYTYPEE